MKEVHAAELAERFSYTPDLSALCKAVSYREMAAQYVEGVYSFGEVAWLLEQVLKVQEVINPEDTVKRCNLLLAIGRVLFIAGEPRHVLDTKLPVAFALAEDIGEKYLTIVRDSIISKTLRPLRSYRI